MSEADTDVTVESLGARIDAYHAQSRERIDKLTGAVKEMAGLQGFDGLPEGGRPSGVRGPELAGLLVTGRAASAGRIVGGSDDYKRFLKESEQKDGHRALLAVQMSQADWNSGLSAAAPGPLGSGAASLGAFVPPDLQSDPIVMARRQNKVKNLFRWTTTTSNLIRYPKQTSRNLNAGTVPELTPKSQSDMAATLLDTQVQVLAHWAYISRQALDDGGAVISDFVDSELKYGLDLLEEAQLLYGDGTGANLTGIMTTAAAYDITKTFVVAQQNVGSLITYFDVLLQAIGQLAASFFTASGIILNPLDYLFMLTLKDGQNRYLTSGPLSQLVDLLWSVPWVPSWAIPKGTFCVGDFVAGAAGFQRDEVNILISFHDGDNFRNNRATILAEEREALVVKQAGAFIKGTFSDAVTANDGAQPH